MILNERQKSEWYFWVENIFFKFINLLPPPIRKLLLKQVLGSLGKNTFIGENCYFRYPWKVMIGKNVSIGPFAQIYPSFKVPNKKIIIEDNVAIGPGLFIFGAGHPVDNPLELDIAASVKIKENTYIGGNVTIRYGVTIGKNCIIGMGSIVVSDIPDDTLATGVPAKAIKNLNPFSD